MVVDRKGWPLKSPLPHLREMGGINLGPLGQIPKVDEGIEREGEGDWESHWGSHFLPNRKNVTESPSFSAGDNPPVLFSSDFRISGAPEKVRARTVQLQASWRP